MSPRYPIPWRIGLVLFWDALRSNSRSFRADSHTCISLLSPPLQIINPENIPGSGPCLLITNHYSRPGFQAWWIALAISAALPIEIHWMMTNAWTFLGPLTPFSQWTLSRIARVYGFTSSPPMPPRPQDMEARARAVRQVLKISRSSAAVIALAPEGCDHPGGILGPFPPGAGRFIEKLVIHLQRIVPVGVYEDDQALCLRFGPAFELKPAPQQSAEIRDQAISQQIATTLARQLPPHLRGKYAT